jgi:hypothetical protein
MRLIILKETGTVGKDGETYDDLDLSSCNLPNNLWALQWYDNNTGHIEYDSPMIQNDEITELPDWTNACINVWQAAKEAAIAAAAEKVAVIHAEEEAAAVQAAAE